MQSAFRLSRVHLSAPAQPLFLAAPLLSMTRLPSASILSYPHRDFSSSPPRDRVLLKGLTFHAYHGYFQAEKDIGQKFKVDCEIVTDLRPAGKSDDLRHTLNYAAVYDEIQNIFVKGEQHSLLETVADKMAASLCRKYPHIHQLTLRVTKPHPPVAGVLDSLGIEITRSPSDYQDTKHPT